MAAGLAVLLGGFLFAAYYREKRLLKWGTAAYATIVAEERHRTRSGECITLHFEFVDTEGTTYPGERPEVPLPESDAMGQAQRQRLMTRPVALYHPKRPKLNGLYPFELVKLQSAQR